MLETLSTCPTLWSEVPKQQVIKLNTVKGKEITSYELTVDVRTVTLINSLKVILTPVRTFNNTIETGNTVIICKLTPHHQFFPITVVFHTVIALYSWDVIFMNFMKKL